MRRILWPFPARVGLLLGLVALGLGAGQGCGTTVSLGDACRGGALCDGVCVDLETDGAHCGDCETACPAGVPCSGGVCLAGCASDLTPCGGGCVDTSSDPANCGACGAPCGAPGGCVGGRCACAPPSIDCSGLCIDPTSDPNNCGGCFITCPPDSKCAGAFCAPACPIGLAFCGGTCVDTLSDPTNCGACGITCPGGQPCTKGFCSCAGVCGACSVTDLGSSVPQGVSSTTRGGVDVLSGSCAPPGSPEVVFSFTAPADGFYDFDTAGSSYDTTLYVLDGNCTELACNDDAGQVTAKVTVPLAGMQTVYVAVDGKNGSEGPFVLDVTPSFPCAAEDLGSSVPQIMYASTQGSQDLLAGSCGGAGSPELAYVFTAPSTGTFTFDTYGSSYNTVLYVLDGACFGPELACNDDSIGTASQVTVALVAGQVVVIVVDGFGSGDFALNIN